MTEKIIFVFPGQGAQYVGMGRGMYRDYAVARYTLEQVGDIAHRDIRKISLDGPESELNTPENTSLATFAQSVATARVIEHEFGMPLHAIAYAMAGHSMGQYSALHCVGSLAIGDAVRMLAARSAYMGFTSVKDAGMAAIVGMDYDKLMYVMRTADAAGYAEISNHNAVDQFVVRRPARRVTGHCGQRPEKWGAHGQNIERVGAGALRTDAAGGGPDAYFGG